MYNLSKKIECSFNEWIECNQWAEHPYKCEKCGWNPEVADIRKAAIRMGERRFLRYSARDFDRVLTHMKGKKHAML